MGERQVEKTPLNLSSLTFLGLPFPLSPLPLAPRFISSPFALPPPRSLASTELSALHDYFKASKESLSHAPSSLDQLADVVNLHKRLVEEKAATVSRFDPLREKYKVRASECARMDCTCTFLSHSLSHSCHPSLPSLPLLSGPGALRGPDPGRPAVPAGRPRRRVGAVPGLARRGRREAGEVQGQLPGEGEEERRPTTE